MKPFLKVLQERTKSRHEGNHESTAGAQSFPNSTLIGFKKMSLEDFGLKLDAKIP